MNETEISAQIAAACARLGLPVIRIHSGRWQTKSGHWMHGAAPGTPDRLVLGPYGRCLFLEVKQPHEDLRQAQEQWKRGAARLGHTVVRVDSVRETIVAVKQHLQV